MTTPTILCPIDFSESSDAAADLAAKVARAQDARLVLLHVDPTSSLSRRSSLATDAVAELRRSHEQWLEGRLETARKRLQSDTRAEAVTRLTDKDPAVAILEEAAAIKPALIVIATHGSGLRRLLLGSVAQKVAREAPCPVLLIRGDADCAVPFAKPLICVDFSPLSEPAASTALGLAADDAEVELLHVVDEPGVAAVQISLGQRQEVLDLLDTMHKEALADLEKFAASLPLDSRSPTLTVMGGPIAGTILSHAGASKSTLVVVGSHEPDNLRQRILGTVADRVLRHADVPVLLCPPGSAS